MLRYIRIHPKQDVLPTARRYLGRRRGEPAAAILILCGARAGGRGHPRRLAAAGEEVFNRRRRSQEGNDRKEGPTVGTGDIRLCSLASQHRLHQSQEGVQAKRKRQVRRNVPAAWGRTLPGCEAHSVERCGMVDERTRVEIEVCRTRRDGSNAFVDCAARTSAWFSVRKRRHS